MYRSVCLAAIVAVALCSSAVAASSEAFPSSCTGTTNNLPVFTGEPTLVTTVPNGRKYVVDAVDPPLNVLHVYGTPYEMGFARGTMMKDAMVSLIPEVYEYLYSEIETYLHFLPPSWIAAIDKYGIEIIVDLTYALTKPFIAPEFMEEIYGIANATDIKLEKLLGVTLLPEIIKASCSMFGAWGPATQNSRDGALVQLRALDWSTNGPFQKFPEVLVYHPNEGNGHAYAVLTWTGFVGAITGYSSVELGVCEKVWLHYKGKDSRAGIPFTFLLRDILQYDTTIEQAVTRIETANRTCSIFVGVGSAAERSMDIIEYSLQEVNVYNDTDFPAYPPAHDLMDGVVFVDKHTQPSNDPCLNDLLKMYYGNIDPLVTLRNITAVFQTGDMHVAIYDFDEHTMTVANAGVYNNVTKTAVPAYDRTFVQLNMTQAFALAAPTGF